MDDKNKLEITATFAPYDQLKSKFKAKAMLEKITKRTVQHYYQPKATRVIWRQCASSWIRKS